MKETIGVIGQGFVGSAVREGMQNHFNVLAYDKDPNKFSNVEDAADIIKQAEVIFVCVPTPMRKSGECDLSILSRALELNQLSHPVPQNEWILFSVICM
jgi:UDP-glucose 6-dehydrogenase